MFLRGILITAAIGVASPSLACVYEPVVPPKNKNQTILLGTCGFYERGYRLEGNTLHFPNGGTHAIADTPEQEARAVLKEAYGLVEVEDGMYVRTKDVILSQ
jgi:hypothetical protein